MSDFRSKEDYLIEDLWDSSVCSCWRFITSVKYELQVSAVQ